VCSSDLKLAFLHVIASPPKADVAISSSLHRA
jgi:hypothetical protein